MAIVDVILPYTVNSTYLYTDIYSTCKTLGVRILYLSIVVLHIRLIWLLFRIAVRFFKKNNAFSLSVTFSLIAHFLRVSLVHKQTFPVPVI